MAIALSGSLLEPVIKFSFEKLESQTWKDTYIGLIALGSMLECKDQAVFERMIGPHIPALVTLMQNESEIVRKSSSWVFCVMAENSPDLLGSSEVLTQLFTKCLEGMARDNSVVACQQATLIGEICKNFEKGAETNFLSDKADTVLKALLEFSYNTTNNAPNGDYS